MAQDKLDLQWFWVQQSARGNRMASTDKVIAYTAQEAVRIAFSVEVESCGSMAAGGEYITQAQSEAGFSYWSVING